MKAKMKADREEHAVWVENYRQVELDIAEKEKLLLAE